jgi:hypothetical protein
VARSYNELATLMSVTGEDAIRHLFSRGTHREFGYAAILVMLVFYFLGAAWTGAGRDCVGVASGWVCLYACLGGKGKQHRSPSCAPAATRATSRAAGVCSFAELACSRSTSMLVGRAHMPSLASIPSQSPAPVHAAAPCAAGSAISSGVFVPMLLIGACIGRLVGLVGVDIAAAHGAGSEG